MPWSELRRMFFATAILCLPLGLICATEPMVASPAAKVELRSGEFKLLKANSRVVRLATSNPEVCSAVIYDGRTLAIWGRSSGTSDVTVWLADRSSSPVVWVVDVK